MSKTEKEKERLEKKLSSILSAASSAKAWSDLLPITKDILQLLAKKTDVVNFSKLSNKLLLAKRLAQCLNPECPSGVHEVVLDIYYLILHNIVFHNETCLMDNLGIYACGLFPFYPYASINNKTKFIDKIIYGCFLCFRPDELVLCLPGLLTSLIQGLDDNNDSTKEKIFLTFNDIIKKAGENNFYGIYWTLILRNKLLRSSGMKFLLGKIIKYSNYEQLPDNEKKEVITNEFPNINTVVVNALCQVIEEKEIPTVRAGMDFVITRLPLTKSNNLITDNAKITLLISIFKLFIKNDSSTIRRLKNLILGTQHDDDEFDLESEDMKYKINLVIQAFFSIFNPKLTFTKINLKNNLTIIRRFLEEQMDFSSLILPKISYKLLLCVMNYWKKELNSSEKADEEEIITKFKDFINMNSLYLEWLWISIADNLKSLVINNELKDNENKEDYLSSDDRIFLDIVNEALLPLKFSIIFLEIKSVDKKIKYYLPIITHLLNLMRKFIINNRASLEKLRQILLTTLVLIKSLQEKSNENVNNTNPDITPMPLSNSVNFPSFSGGNNSEIKKEEEPRKSIFQQIEEEVEETKDKFFIIEEASLKGVISSISTNKEDESILNNLTEAILNFQKYYIELLLKYKSINKDNQVTKNEMTIFQQSTEITIRLQEYAQQTEIPDWISFLQKIIFDTNINKKLSLEAANYLVDMNMSSFNHHDIYDKIKYNFQNKEIDTNIIDKDTLNDLVSKTLVKNNCQELLMGKLYLILKEQSHQKNIIDLLIKIANMDQLKFLNIIKNTFNLNNFASLQQSMKLFSDFWKLSNEYYNEMIFFKKGECIFQMIDCLDVDDPLLRHLAKCWLNQAHQQFHKILDPIFQILLENKICLQKNEEHILIEKEYSTTEIRKCFRRLKNIILNSPVMDFLIKTQANQDIKEIQEIQNNYTILNTNSETQNKKIFKYLDLLIVITLRFTQVKCAETLNNEFKRENYSVNASSGEFLEFLLNKIENKDLLMKYASEINEPVVSLLFQAIETTDEVMQVQLLSVLKVIYFNSSSVHLKSMENKKAALSLFLNKNLHKCLIMGMTSEYFFVRENFIKFTVSCLPHFNNVMNDNNGYKHLFEIGANFISGLTKYIGGRIEIDMKGRKDTEKFSLFDKKNNAVIFKNYLDEYKEYKRYDDNDILMLLTGLRDIIFQFMGGNIDKKGKERKSKSKSNMYWIELKKMMSGNKKNNLNISNFFSNLFGLENESNENKEGEISVMPKNLFNGQIYNLMNCLLLTWINKSDKYEDYDFCLNSNGILPPKENENLGTLSKSDIEKNISQINHNPINRIILQIAKNLFKIHPINFIETLLNIWCFKPKKENDNKNTNLTTDKLYKLSLMELLISMKIPLNIILFCLGKVIQKKISSISKDKRYIKNKEHKCYVTPYEFSLFEAKFFHFIYSYILLNPLLDDKDIFYNNNPIFTEKYESWKEFINLANIVIYDTKIIYTHCWIYEVIQLLLYKFPLKSIKENTEIKKGLIDIFNTVTNKLMEASFEGQTDSIYINSKQLVLPILPHVYYNIFDELVKNANLYKKDSLGQKQEEKEETQDKAPIFKETPDNKEEIIQEKKKIEDGENLNLKEAKGKVNDFYRVYYSAARACSEYLDESIIVSHESQLLNEIYRNLAFIILKSDFHKIAQGIYFDNQNLLKKKLLEIINGDINLIKSFQNIRPEDLFYAEFSSDFLLSLMKELPDISSKIGKDIFINYLNGPTFFHTTPKMLRNWREIISISAKHYPDLLSDLIKTMGGGFLSLGSSDEDKIKTLRRISFVIYSCAKDTFAREFEEIKSKVKDLLGSDNKNNKLKDEIFLMMRILFLRFSHDGVMKMIKDLWPIIFTELIQNIEDPKRNNDIDLVIESFKFIELLSLANVEEFCLYQWIFILDTYNMSNLDYREPKSFISILFDEEHHKVFKPITIKFLFSKKMFDNIDDSLLKINTGKSELYICPKENKEDNLLKEVRKFVYSIGDMNSYKVPIKYEQIEDIIEKDFIDIDFTKIINK